MMGAQAWLRAFTTPGGFFVWLPQAVMWTKAKNGNNGRHGNTYAANRFVTNTRYWSQIGGWFFTLSTLAGSTYLVYPTIFNFSTITIDIGLLSSTGTCTDTNRDHYGYLTYDSYGDACSQYISSWCGNYDTSNFRSNEMCCICGGGSYSGSGSSGSSGSSSSYDTTDDSGLSIFGSTLG